MKERERKKSWKRIGAVLAAFVLLVSCTVQTWAALPTVKTDVEEASEGCVLLGVEGKFISDAQNAVKRINEIRYEACKEGVPHPETGKSLTLSDYVPLKWSSDLEYIARIRAAEASIYLDHVRPNGTWCFSAVSPNGVGSYAEDLAWNWTESMLYGIEQWYSEKEDWVNQTPDAVTGHYTSMINPEYRCVGLGTFYSTSTRYANATSAEFSYLDDLDDTAMQNTGACIQTVEIQKELVSGAELTGSQNVTVDKTAKLTFAVSVYTDGFKTEQLHVFSPVSWTSSNTNIATVDQNGVVSGKTSGTVTITAVAQNGYRASAKVTVNRIKVGSSQVRLSATSYTCNGTVHRPKVSVKDKNGKVIPSSGYTVTYETGSKNVGRYKVTVRMKGKYQGTISKTYDILPKGTSIAKLTAKPKGFTVKWKKQSNQTSGYQIQYATNKSFKSAKIKTITKNKTTQLTLQKLKAKKKYYVRIRTYKTVKVNGKSVKLYSGWSKAKSVTTKR